MTAGTRGDEAGVLALRSRGPEETRRVGERVARLLVGAGPAGAVVALSGPLGAGKTCFVQGLGRGLGVSAGVRSPTFVLIHEYPGAVPLYHVDLYRLGSADLDALGLDEILEGPGITAVEWPEHGGGALPADRLSIALDYGEGECDRILWIAPRGARYVPIVEALRACASLR